MIAVIERMIRENPKAVRDLLMFVKDGENIELPRDDKTGTLIFRKVETLG